MVKPKLGINERLRRLLPVSVFALAVLALVVTATFAIYRAGREQATPVAGNLATYSGQGGNGSPPWVLPTDVPKRVGLAGLNLGRMGTAEHYHVHLDVIVDGKSVGVPANIGVNPNNGSMSAVHTHTADGIVHIEAGTKGQPFTLGQLFTQWNVRLSTTRVGSFAAGGGNSLNVFVNGKPVTGDPALIRLAERQEIAIMFGPTGNKVKVPTSYPFPDGL